MRYTYNDMEDKSKSGIDKELVQGLVVAAVYFTQSFGIPVELFKEWVEGDGPLKTKADQLLWYMNFRSMHPKLFIKK